jgi:hypothetical protein
MQTLLPDPFSHFIFDPNEVEFGKSTHRLDRRNPSPYRRPGNRARLDKPLAGPPIGLSQPKDQRPLSQRGLYLHPDLSRVGGK